MCTVGKYDSDADDIAGARKGDSCYEIARAEKAEEERKMHADIM